MSLDSIVNSAAQRMGKSLVALGKALLGVRGEAGSLIDNVVDNSGIQAGHNGGMSNVT